MSCPVTALKKSVSKRQVQKNSRGNFTSFPIFRWASARAGGIGALFAEAEAMLAIASILQRFQIRAVSNAVVTPIAVTTLRPGEEGMKVMVRAGASGQGSTVPSPRKSCSYRAFVAA